MKRNKILLVWLLFIAIGLIEGSPVNDEVGNGVTDVDSNGPDFSSDLRLKDAQSEEEEGDLEAREVDATGTLWDTTEAKDVATARQKDYKPKWCEAVGNFCASKSVEFKRVTVNHETAREKFNEAMKNYRKLHWNTSWNKRKQEIKKVNEARKNKRKATEKIMKVEFLCCEPSYFHDECPEEMASFVKRHGNICHYISNWTNGGQ